jgi:quercetin dioxygenase-like cupin family protein
MVMGTREEIRSGQLAIRFLVEGQASGGSVAVFECNVPAGAKAPAAHSHDGYQKTIYGLDGVLTLTVDGRRSEVGPGEALCIPRGATASTMATRLTRRCSRSSARASSGGISEI